MSDRDPSPAQRSAAPIEIRPEEPADLEAVRLINERAFDQPDEAALVDQLRARGGVTLSLVACREGTPCGHILYTPLLDPAGGLVPGGVALGPMAVLPGDQRQGVGTALIEQSLRELRVMGAAFVLVLGHPTYYPRFGFEPARNYGVTCEFEVPAEILMVMPLRPDALSATGREVRYQPEFSAL